MKKIDLTCPKCAGMMELNADESKCICPYCGNEMLIEQRAPKRTAPPAPTEPQKKENLGMTALVLGTVSLFTCGLLGLPEVIGIILSILSMRKEKALQSRMAAIIGLVECILALSLILFYIFGSKLLPDE